MIQSKETIVITGGTRGLGLAIARALGKPGTRLILSYRSDHENAQKVKDGFQQNDLECHLIPVDLSEDGASDRLFEKIRAVSSTLSVYIHNAAATVFKPLLEVKPHHIQKTFNISVTSFIQNVQHAAAMMPNGGAIVSVSGLDTLEAVPFHGVLASAKAALQMLTTYWAHELVERNIRVNGVNPGYLETDSVRKYMGPMYEQAKELIQTITPGGRRVTLEDISSVVEFLASEKSRWILGQTIVVDGGQTFRSPISLLMGKKQ